MNQPQRTSGKAIAALVLGIAGIIIPCVWIVCSTLAIVFGHQGRQDVGRDPTLGGGGMATAGFVLGIVGLALGVFVQMLFLWPLFLI